MLLCTSTALSAATWQGTVFNDSNGNGRRDGGEAGIAGVAVSNGAAVVRTDAAGRYVLNGEGEGFVFVVKPRGWRIPVEGSNLPAFYRRLAGGPGAPGDGRSEMGDRGVVRVPSPGESPRQGSAGATSGNPGNQQPSMPSAQSSGAGAGTQNPGAALDFPLVAAVEPDAFRALVFADTQVGSEKEIGYLERTIIDGIVNDRGGPEGQRVGGSDNRGRASGPALPPAAALPSDPQTLRSSDPRIAFGVTLGDVTNDKPELYDALNRAIARIGVPWYPLLGNHDLDLGAMQDRGSAATFEAKYGPSTHAFQYGQVLFVALNNVRYQGGLRYLGGLTDGQFGWIEQLLAGTPRETLVVVMMHIPWFFNDPANNATFRLADRARLFGLLAGRPNLLLLSGHSHYQRHVFYTAAEGWTGAVPLHEYNVAAASGGFWGGPPDASGIPIATQWDGTPHGYAILSFDGTKPPQMDYRAARKAPDDQIGLWGPAVVALKQGFVSFYANVYNGHEGWKIEARVDDRTWGPMRKVVDWDPGYAAQYLAQDAGPAPAPTPRLPDPLVNYHLWRAYLPADLAAGPHTIEVRATDPAGMIYTARRDVIIR